MRLADEPSYPPTWRGRYPGLDAESQALATRWLERHQNEITRMYYNVRLYPTPAETPDLPADEAALWRELSALRIDAVAVMTNGLFLVEFAVNPSAATLGRVTAYAERFPKQFPDTGATGSIVVYQNDNPVILSTIRNQGFILERA